MAIAMVAACCMVAVVAWCLVRGAQTPADQVSARWLDARIRERRGDD